MKYGSDPRKSPEAREFQTIDFRTTVVRGEPTNEYHHRKKPTDKPTRASNRSVLDQRQQEEKMRHNRYLEQHFEKPPSQKQITLWIPDLTGVPGLSELLQEEPGETCEKAIGWFSKATFKKLRQALKSYGDTLVEQWDREHGAPTANTDTAEGKELRSDAEEDEDAALADEEDAATYIQKIGKEVMRGEIGSKNQGFMDVDDMEDDDGYAIIGEDDDDDEDEY